MVRTKMMERVGVSERIFGEIKEIEDLDFEFSEERQPADNVETLCENMHFFPPELYLTGDDLLFEYDGGLISDCLAGLNASEVNVFVMAKEFREGCNSIDILNIECETGSNIGMSSGITSVQRHSNFRHVSQTGLPSYLTF